METSLKKVSEPIDDKPCCEFRVVFSDMDVNRHVTAARYTHWTLELSCYGPY